MSPYEGFKKSLFVVIEGVDFSGKTTLIERLKLVLKEDEKIRSYFKKIIYTQEPNSQASSFCLETRKMALENHEISELTRALLFFANRSEHIRLCIGPAIEEGSNLIICDRFYLSTLVYQHNEDPRMTDWIRETQRLVSNVTPDINYVIDLDQALFVKRYANRARGLFDERVKEKFNEIDRLYKWFMERNEEYNLGEIRRIYQAEINVMASEIMEDIKERILD